MDKINKIKYVYCPECKGSGYRYIIYRDIPHHSPQYKIELYLHPTGKVICKPCYGLGKIEI